MQIMHFLCQKGWIRTWIPVLIARPLMQIRTLTSTPPFDKYMQKNYSPKSSVADPCNFGVDPDPDPRIHASD
jgi:hypothetical protein